MTSTMRLSGLIAVSAWILSIMIDYSMGIPRLDVGFDAAGRLEDTKPGAAAVWSPWGEWGECEGPCGSRRKMFRRRKCIKSSPDQDCPRGKPEHVEEESWISCPSLCLKEE